jgi:hypothetical protein
MESEEELLAMLSAVKQQKAALAKQHQVVLDATDALAVERVKMIETLNKVQTLPGQLLEPLKTAVESAAERGVLSSTSQERKALKTAVDGAVERLEKVKKLTVWAIVVFGMIGGVTGTAITGGVFWYAINSGWVRAPAISLDVVAVAAAIRANLPAPAALAPRRKPRPQQQLEAVPPAEASQ